MAANNTSNISTNNEDAVPIRFTQKEAMNAQRTEDSIKIIQKNQRINSVNMESIGPLYDELKEKLEVLYKHKRIPDHILSLLEFLEENEETLTLPQIKKAAADILEALEEQMAHKYLEIGVKKPSKEEIKMKKMTNMLMGAFSLKKSKPKPLTLKLNKHGKVIFGSKKPQTKKKRKN
jgi:hypothetical protein